MNLGQIATEVQRLTGRNDSNFVDRIYAAVNRAQRQWARSLPWQSLKIIGEIAHSGGRDLYFPLEVERLCWLMDKTNEHHVEAGTQWEVNDAASLAQDMLGYATQWEDYGLSPTWTSVSGPVYAVSSSVSDICTIFITGKVQHPSVSGPLGRFELTESLSVAGTGVTGTQNFLEVKTINKSIDSVGYFTLYCSGSPVAIIPPYEREPRHRRVRLIDIPIVGTVFTYGAYTQPMPLVHASQSPPQSVDCDFLVYAAAADIFWQTKEGQNADAAWKRAGEIARHVQGSHMQFGEWCGRIIPENSR